MGFGTALMVEADPSNYLNFLNYFSSDYSSVGSLFDASETNLRVGDWFLVRLTVAL